MDGFEKLAPFALRSGAVVVGRERLMQLRNRLAFVLLTTDISERSCREMCRQMPCPVYQALSTDDVERLFQFHNTKVIGFRRMPIAVSLQAELRAHLIQPASSQPRSKRSRSKGEPSDPRRTDP